MKKVEIDAFWLKIIAIIAMTFNHIEHILGTHLTFDSKLPAYMMFFIGGLTFPIMAFLIVEGYKKTSNIKKYMLRLLVFAIVAQVPYSLAFQSWWTLNVLFTLLLGLVSLYLNDHMKNRILFWGAFIVIILSTIICDWGIKGILLLFFMGTIKGEKKRIIIPISLMAIIWSFLILITPLGPFMSDNPIFSLIYYIGCLFDIPLLLLYNGKRGRNMKYFFYIYYPLHLLILFLLNLYLSR